ncbi:unnamed protein product [Urochloa decumbens]|uniref:HORMA domain-containing protein n=1 Tax=Urochloa decumbens TaxID=240449 RepID=A0ABC9FDL0_9POAL
MQVMSAETQEAESVEKEPLLPTRNLLRIAIYNISYIRGLFHEKYFSDKSVPALEMKIKKLMPMDAESRRLIDWMEKGVYDALQKKYLKTLLFCICEKEEGPMIEEYAFSFSYPNTGTEEVVMNMSRTGSKKSSTTFTSYALEVTPDEMRSSACKMIRTLVSLMRTLDPMPEERTILMKLLYYDDVTPEDYEPPFFKGCADNEAINIWNKNPLKMEVGNVNSKHLVALKGVLDQCDDNNVNSGDDGMSVGNESNHDDDFSDSEVRPFEADYYIVPLNDNTQDAAREEESDALPMDSVTIAKPQGKWNGNSCKYAVQRFNDTMVREQDGYVKNLARKRFGKFVIYSEATKKELETENILEGNESRQKAIDTNAKNDKYRSKDMQGAVGCILCTNPTAKNYWSLDSGASNHICGKNKWFTNSRPIPQDKEDYFLNAAKKKLQLSEMGDIMSQKVRLYNVFLSDDLEANELYVSIGQLIGEGYVVMIDKGEVTIRMARNFNHIVGKGSLDRDTMAYILEFFNGSVLERDEGHSEGSQGEEYEMAEGQWVLDSGCHHHITTDESFLKKKRRLKRKRELHVAGCGSLTCKFKGDVEKVGIRLKNAYLCKGSKRNLISVSQLDVLGYNFLFSGDHCEIKYKDEKALVGIAHVDSGDLNYYVEFLHSKE